MKFYGIGVVWDAGSSKVLCRFENGEFETEDKGIINKLIRLGYKHEEEEEKEVEEEEEEVEDEEDEVEEDEDEEVEDEEIKIDLNNKTVVELRELAKEKGIEGVYTKTKAELIEAVEGD